MFCGRRFLSRSTCHVSISHSSRYHSVVICSIFYKVCIRVVLHYLYGITWFYVELWDVSTFWRQGCLTNTEQISITQVSTNQFWRMLETLWSLSKQNKTLRAHSACIFYGWTVHSCVCFHMTKQGKALLTPTDWHQDKMTFSGRHFQWRRREWRYINLDKYFKYFVPRVQLLIFHHWFR